jgi:hypothetical protein
MPRARAKANDLGLNGELRDADLRTYILEARGVAAGISQPRLQGERLDTTPTPWAWEGVIMAGTLNLLVAPPKVGKSALTIGMIAAWARGDGSYLGHALHGICPNVYIIGTDQPENDWVTLLRREGLVGANDELLDPIKMLWSAGCPLHLSVDGIAHLKQLAADDPGALFLIDSYHACISPLGIDEATSAFDRPARALQEALAPHHATVALIHHTNKSVSGGNATNASRGSNALPAAASLTILMNWLKQPAEGQTQTDYRVIIKTQGRAKGATLVVELTDNGWVPHGDGDEALRTEALADAEAELSGQQADIFDYAVIRWENGRNPVTVAELASHLNKEVKKIDRVVRALVRKGLLYKAGMLPVGLQGGRPAHLFAPCFSVEPGELPPSPLRTGERGEIGITPSRAHEIKGLPPLPHKPHGFQGGVGEGVYPPVDSPLEILIDGAWVNGWKLHPDTRDVHSVVAYRLLAGKPLRKSSLRWGIDVRSCQPALLYEPFDESTLTF